MASWLKWVLALIALAGAGVGLVACAGDPSVGGGERTARVRANHELVANYCAYSSNTWAQVQKCVLHADPLQIKRLNTNAGRYARGELTSCLPHAGRFCDRGRLGPDVYPASWKQLLDARHVRKGKADPQCGYGDVDQCKFEIHLYCSYGAVSRAQLAGCEDNVTWGQFKDLNTKAAEFARDYGLDNCGPDAGPFCKTQTPDYVP